MKVHKSLTLSQDIMEDLKKREGFNASAYFEKKYRNDFLSLDTKKARLDEITKEAMQLEKDVQMMIELSKQKEVAIGKKEKCHFCGAFLDNSTIFRKAILLKDNLKICKECWLYQTDYVKKILGGDENAANS